MRRYEAFMVHIVSQPNYHHYLCQSICGLFLAEYWATLISLISFDISGIWLIRRVALPLFDLLRDRQNGSFSVK